MELIREVLGIGRPKDWKNDCEMLIIEGKTYYVDIQHWRRRREKGRVRWQQHYPGRSKWTPPARGGVTVIKVHDTRGRLLIQSFAICYLDDVYDEQKGMWHAWTRLNFVGLQSGEARIVDLTGMPGLRLW